MHTAAMVQAAPSRIGTNIIGTNSSQEKYRAHSSFRKVGFSLFVAVSVQNNMGANNSATDTAITAPLTSG